MIFGSQAPGFWKAGLPVIPLQFHEKRPVIGDWSRFERQLPTEEEQDFWLKNFSDNNVGLALGPQSNLAMIDIDTDDEALITAIQATLPVSPWCRIGAKGMMLAFRFNGTPTFRIKDISGKTIVEHLAARTQVVLPPSIHPTTKRPYSQNCSLLEVLDQIVPLPGDIEHLLRSALAAAGVKLSHSGWTKVTEYVSVGARDVTMTSVAGLFASGVTKGELSVKQAIERLKAWHSACTEQIAGDDVEVDKGIQNIIKFIKRDVDDKGKTLPVDWDKDLTPEERQSLGLVFDKDQEEWAFEEIKTYLRDAFEQCPAESKGRMDAIDYALKKMAMSTSLNSIDRERLLKYIGEVGGLKVTMTAMRTRMKELEGGEMMGTDHTEIAQAVIEDMKQTHQLAFYKSQFLIWNGSHWSDVIATEAGETTVKQELKRRIAENYGAMAASRKHSDHNGILQVISTILPQEIQVLEVKGVNFANGIVLENLNLVPHDPQFGMMYTLPFRYMPSEIGRAHKFQDFLHRCWGHDEDYQDKLNALQEAICMTIFGLAPRYQRAFLLFGAPKTGKSQLLRIIECLVPDDGRAYCPPDMWADRFAPAMMLGKVLNVCGELSDRRLIDGMKFKSIVCGEEQPGQFKGKDLFKFKPLCAHWFASNHPPKTDDTSSAFIRRWLVFTFNRPVQDKDRIPDYGDMIVAEEREAITAWAIEALPRMLLQNEYTLSASHTQIMDEVANANNSVRYFLKESGVVRCGPGQVTEMKIHQAYFNFCCGPGGAKPFGAKAFRAKMRELSSEMAFSLEFQGADAGALEAVYLGLELKLSSR